jgi:hypothetical protein
MPAEPTKPEAEAKPDAKPDSAPAPAPAAPPAPPAPAAPAPAPPPPAPAPPADEKHIRSPNPLSQPAAGEPAMGMGRLRAFRDDPSDENRNFAAELLKRCGPLVLDGYQYRLRGENGVESIPVEFLGMERQALATGIDKLKVATSVHGED